LSGKFGERVKKGKPKILKRQFHRIDSAGKTPETIAPQRHLRIVFNPGRDSLCGAENRNPQGS
jgi:hypothetical protein